MVVADDNYKSIYSLLDLLAHKIGITYATVDLTSAGLDLAEAEIEAEANGYGQADASNASEAEHLRSRFPASTAIVWAEVISNPLLKVTDVPRIKELLSRRGLLSARIVLDSTWTTPALVKPLELGADIVVHSCTKYIGGHSDVMGGAVIVKDVAILARIREVQTTIGGVMSPFDCYLALRGLRTLDVRMRRHSKNALRLATYLRSAPGVIRVHYPGLPDDPNHHVASRILTQGGRQPQFGGMVSFVIEGGLSEAIDLIARTRLCTKSTSLGATESLIEAPAGLSGNDRIPPSLIRISVGLESSRDIIDDLRVAIEG